MDTQTQKQASEMEKELEKMTKEKIKKIGDTKVQAAFTEAV